MTLRRRSWIARISTAILATFSLCAAGQQQSNPVTPADPGAQIDQLLKQANEQINQKGQLQRAAEFAQQALDLSQKLGDKVRASMALVFLGAAYAGQGRLTEALEVSQKTLVAARESGDKKVLEQALNNAAAFLGESGRYEECLSYLYQLLDVAREIKDPTMQYMSLLNIGEAYVVSGDPDKAEAPLNESLRIARGLKHDALVSNPSKKGMEMALVNLGAMELARQHYQAALKYYEQVHASRPESPFWQMSALQGMAQAQQLLGEHQKAVDLFQQLLPQAEKAASGLAYVRILRQLGVSQEALGRYQDALASQERALALIHENGGSPNDEWQCESRSAHVLRALGRKEEALTHYQTAIREIEQIRSAALNTEEGRAGILAASRATYTETADLLYELQRSEEALAMAERGRARAFLDMLAESREGVIEELSPEQRARENAVLERISSAQKRLWSATTADEKRTYESELEPAEAALEAFHLEVRQNNPRYASVQYPEPITVSEIQNKLLEDRTALVEYLLGEKRSLVWVVTRGTLTTAVLPARQEIEEQVQAYRKLLSGRASALTMDQSTKEINRQGAALYGAIFRPVAAAVASCNKVIIVPDGSLDYLPFEALVAGGERQGSPDSRPRYLVEMFAAVYAPSASALAAVKLMNQEGAAPSKALLAFGNPFTTAPSPAHSAERQAAAFASASREVPAAEDYAERGFSFAPLPYAREEVLAISKLFPATQRRIYLGSGAREETVKSEKLEEFRYIHFATHGFLDETRPDRSGLLLSRGQQSREDGVLQMGEIMRLRMNADLVTLSACSTGLGKLVNGEGILGITRAFFYAGARNVAVTLWNVNDSATAALMASFYRHLNRGLPKREALRQAKLDLLRGPQPLWRHPYYWAAFVLDGEGR